jgi:UDP-N-acetylglucosamine 2-epimerase (non-hydrolysing)
VTVAVEGLAYLKEREWKGQGSPHSDRYFVFGPVSVLCAHMNNSHRILLVMGTRPEVVKLAPVVRAFGAGAAEAIVCVTGQHRSMLEQILGTFSIVPDIDLDVMMPNQTLASLTARVLERMAAVLQDIRPDCVIVQGDTTSAFAASLAAFYERVPVAHVEAGLRTGNKASPFPEEINRRLISPLADFHFAPTERAANNLAVESVRADRIFVTGNTVIDALHSVLAQIDADPVLRRSLDERFAFLDPRRRLVLVTGHRRENFGKPMRDMCEALADIVTRHEDVEVLYPVHLNPRVQEAVKAVFERTPADIRARIHLTPPAEYLEFVDLMRRSYLIITDSGGVQEEAPSLGRPVLVTRDTTERPEAVEAGSAMLVGTDRAALLTQASTLLTDRSAYERMQVDLNPYGDGRASERICSILTDALANRGAAMSGTER